MPFPQAHLFTFKFPRLKIDPQHQMVDYNKTFPSMPGGSYLLSPTGSWYYKPAHRKEPGYRQGNSLPTPVEEHKVPNELKMWALVLT